MAMTLAKAMLVALAAAASAGAQTPHPDEEAVIHVIERLSFGARPADVERARVMGLERYIEEQLNPSRIADDGIRTRLAGLQTLDLSSSEIAARFYSRPQRNSDAAKTRAPQTRRQAALPLLELSQQKILRAAYSDRQLEEVLLDFWFNHFNVFSGKGQFARFYLTEYEREAIRPHVLGRFRDMLGATAKSPAMLWYLDNWLSAAPAERVAAGNSRVRRGRRPPAGNTQPGRVRRGLNENYARELLELHTLGVDGGYTQEDVVNVARAFTGWTIDAPRQGGGDFTFNARIHDRGEKMVLGQRIPAGGGRDDGERVLDVVAAHPSTARHIALKLATRLVSDAPPAALVDRVATVFRDTGGDLRAVTRAIITSPEFMAPEARRAKVKTPFEFVASALRVTGAEVANAAPLVQQLRTLGMPLYGAQPPTGYADDAASWINSGALLARMNFAVALSENRIPGTRVQTEDPKALALRLGSVDFQRR